MPHVVTSLPHLQVQPRSGSGDPTYPQSVPGPEPSTDGGRAVFTSLGDFERQFDVDSARMSKALRENAETSSDDFNRMLLGAMSATTLGAFAWQVRRSIRGQLPAIENNAGGVLKNPRYVAYAYAGGAFTTATVITGLGGFALFTGLWSYLGVTTWPEFNQALRARFQQAFPSLVIHKGPEPRLSQDVTWREFVAEVRQEFAAEEAQAREKRDPGHWGEVLKRAGEGAMASQNMR